MVGWLIWCLRFHLNHRNILILELLDETLKKELQENFQIANISELVSFDEENISTYRVIFPIH
jgi:predicted aldo/keto reductase-like oxidoreductase